MREDIYICKFIQRNKNYSTDPGSVRGQGRSSKSTTLSTPHYQPSTENLINENNISTTIAIPVFRTLLIYTTSRWNHSNRKCATNTVPPHPNHALAIF